MKPKKDKEQSSKFIASARAAACDESEAAFDGKLKRIAKAAPKSLKKAGKK